MTKVGFVGLGSQGAPMARRVIDAGFPTTLWARRPEALERFAGTPAHLAESRAELGAASEVLCVCVLDDGAVDDVLRGPDGALASMSAGGAVVIHSTVNPSTCERLQADFPDLTIVDAPVSGGGHKAETGELLVMTGGPEEVVERCRPVLETFGDPVVHLGPLGAGQQAKLLNNALFAAHLGLAAELYDLAASRQLDQQAFATILAAGSGRSYATELVGMSGFGLDGLAAVAGSLLAKDVGLIVELAQLTGSPLLAAADAALDRMGVPRTPRKDVR